MALKSSDPRKLGESNLDTDRFERIVADAWMHRHEDDGSGSETGHFGHAEDPGAAKDYDPHAPEPTHQPFADLKDLLRGRH